MIMEKSRFTIPATHRENEAATSRNSCQCFFFWGSLDQCMVLSPAACGLWRGTGSWLDEADKSTAIQQLLASRQEPAHQHCLRFPRLSLSGSGRVLQAGLEFRPPAAAASVLRLHGCATMPGFPFLKKIKIKKKSYSWSMRIFAPA